MKRIKYLLLVFMLMVIFPSVASAASGTISVSGTSTAVYGNNITVTVTISSGTPMGSWQADLDYNKTFLQLVSTTTESGGSGMANSSATGTKSKSYTFVFKALKTGSTTVSVGSYMAYTFSGMNEINLTSSSKTIKIITQQELEASYSDDAYLKSLTVGDKTLEPAFNKTTYSYSVEVENPVTSINISAVKNNAYASVAGGGDVTLEEGDNKFDIVVTAQKGNTQTYTVNIYRKELDPITATLENKSYKIIRKAENIPENKLFTQTEVTYGENTIPALTNEALQLILIGLVDEDGNKILVTYTEKDGIGKEYFEINNDILVVTPLDFKLTNDFKNYVKKTVIINNKEVEVYALKENSSIVVIYGQNVLTGIKDYYFYNTKRQTLMNYDNSIDKFYTNNLKIYKYIIFGLAFLSAFNFFLFLIKKPKNKTKKVVEMKEIKEIDIEEIKVENEKEKKKESKQEKTK